VTYRYGEDNEKKRGPRWLLTHCAFCGDPHQVFPYGSKLLTEICACTAGTQHARRWVREHHDELVAASSPRARVETRPDRRDDVTKLGA
jgi:hypothetical protein